MNPDFDNPNQIKKTEPAEESTLREGLSDNLNQAESIESEKTIAPEAPELRIEALEEGIRLTGIGRDSARTDLDRWRSNPTTDPSHFEFHLPEIQNRISRAEQSITSSKLDIKLIKASPSSPAEGDRVIKDFVTNQILSGKTAHLKEKLATLGNGDESTTESKTEKEVIQREIDDVLLRGLTDEELPKSLQEDPDFSACLQEADTYASEDSMRSAKARGYRPEATAEKLFRDRFPQKSAFYDRQSNSNKQSEGSSLESDTVSIENESGEVSKTKTINTIKEAIADGKITPTPNLEKLEAEPILDTKVFYDIEPPRSEQSSFEYVDTNQIVGRPNADNYENGWAHEYSERDGRIGEIVDQLNNPDNQAGIESIFHTEEQTNDRIKLAGYKGPAGPMYAVLDGTHRVAGIKASGLDKMPAEIFSANYPLEKISADREEISDWESKIEQGFIVGSIKTVETDKGQRSVLMVEREVLPWIRTRNQNDIFKINQMYDRLYPGAIEKAGFPPETLSDKTALWAFMDGNFDQWKQLQAENSEVKTRQEQIKRPKSITTAKGSVYTYLEDGRTQRFKTIEGEMKEPQNILTFIPRIDSIGDWEHFDRLPDWIKENDNNQVMEMLASGYIHNPNKRVVLTNESNEIVRSNADAAKAKSLLLQFVDNATNQTEFALPVSSEPEIGATTYDARYFDKDGKQRMSAHIGNEIVSISYE